MSFDKPTRNALGRMVGACRRLLTQDVRDQLQRTYGLQPDGAALPVERLAHLDEQGRDVAAALREWWEHLAAQAVGSEIERRRAAFDRMAHETGFTVVNRLAALRMCEERGLVLECVRRGTESDGFAMFEAHTGGMLGTRNHAYRAFLERLFDELAVDLGALFDRRLPQSLIFPADRCLEEVLALLNAKDVAHLWTEDETIGWVYQYFNPPEERKAMREASQAPRNSRELAVRNQFFTPRYVVEFLTDNTLGRIWYEMRTGDTALKDECRYLVRRPNEVFLGPGEKPPASEETTTDLSLEELLRKPVYVQHRPKKDPRDLKVLDLASGSGHFLLYAFDLLERIYEEAWEDPASPKSEATGRTLREDYESLDRLRRAGPELILRWNLHGIDIDSRCVQISALALWLRAQKSWQRLGLKAAERPTISKSNIVTAEPMPGEEEIRKEFVDGLRPRVLGQLVEVVFEKMKLAGEAGSLLRIEEKIKDAVAQAKKEYQEELLLRKVEAGYLPGMAPPREPTLFDFTDLSDDDFWNQAEQRIFAALKQYAEQAENGRPLRRRLFAEDAARGFAFIDLCRKRYDVVLMNPPFGSPTERSASYLKTNYTDTKDDVDAAFVDRAASLLWQHGSLGGIYNRTQFFKGYLDSWRIRNLIRPRQIEFAIDLGYGVLDGALVEAACYTTRRSGDYPLPAVFYRLLSASEKADDLLTAVSLRTNQDDAGNRNRFIISPRAFLSLPGQRISYWATPEMIKSFSSFRGLEGHWGEARQGLITSDNDRFLRLTWEVHPRELARRESETLTGKRWVFYGKGGEYSPYYGSIHLVVNWGNAGSEIKNFVLPSGKLASRPQNLGYYFKPAITYTERTASAFSPRVLPQGCIFDCKGPIIAPTSHTDALYVLGFCMSKPFGYFIELSVAAGDAASSGSAARQYTQSIVGSVPVPNVPDVLRDSIRQSVADVWMLRCDLERKEETDPFFLLPHLLFIEARSAEASICDLIREAVVREETVWLEIVRETGEIEKYVSDCYGLDAWSLEEIKEEMGRHPSTLPRRELDASEDGLLAEYLDLSIESIIDKEVERTGGCRALTKKAFFADRKLEVLAAAFGCHPERIIDKRHSIGKACWQPRTKFVEELLSYAFGCAFGRWDARVALDRSLAPNVPGPFDPLPVCTPGMLVGPDGLPAKPGGIVSEEWLRARQDANALPVDWGVAKSTILDSEYPLSISWGGIMVDDPGGDGNHLHQDDIVRGVREVLELLWKERAEVIEHEACTILGVRTLREYFRKPAGFFADHLSRYSKSRRQAPIYWPLSTTSGSYTVWIYYHRLNDDLLYKVVNDYVNPKIAEAERRIGQIESDLGSASGRHATRLGGELEEARLLREELEDFKAEILRVAGLPYRPNLNDGVLITASPLWRLFRLPKWRKDLEACWKELEAGEYDWAHLALAIWPDRVKEKCRRDRSIAIAHGLEDLYQGEASIAAKRSRRARKP